MIRKALIAATLAAVTLTAGSAGAAETTTVAKSDYSKYFQLTAGRSDYERCASFSIAVYNACLQSAGNNSSKIRSCRSHYQGNVQRCQAIR